LQKQQKTTEQETKNNTPQKAATTSQAAETAVKVVPCNHFASTYTHCLLGIIQKIPSRHMPQNLQCKYVCTGESSQGQSGLHASVMSPQARATYVTTYSQDTSCQYQKQPQYCACPA
jgi:hypothetical protein